MYLYKKDKERQIAKILNIQDFVGLIWSLFKCKQI